MTLRGSKLCLVGAGNMGGAMLAGWIEGGIRPGDVTVIDPSPREDMASKLAQWGVATRPGPANDYVADVLIIAVKPQMMEDVLPGLSGIVGKDTVSISVAAGTTIAALAKHLGNGAIVRVMPNTPALLRRGVSAGFANSQTSEAMKKQVRELLEAVGKFAWVDEEWQIDAVTAVSGSGPAYVFHLAECMAASAVKEGLSTELANLLARETIAGAGEMLSQLPDSSARLRENVTSPNGTTAAALAVLMAEPGMGDLFSRAIHAARLRSEELSK
jgi:pyrroline-5-carboxylate reductase